jgi:aryl-alcohol dehydrogenase-like predicted oxidoreductase
MTMGQRALGRTGLQVSVLGFGGPELGFDDGVTENAAFVGWTSQQ